MKTITVSRPFDKGATQRTSIVRQFKEVIEEIAEGAGSKALNFEISDGCVTFEVADDKAADAVIDFIKKMSGVQVATASTSEELFLVAFNRNRAN